MMQRFDDPMAASPSPTGPLIVGPAPPNAAIELSIVVPTLDEADNIADFLQALRAVLDAALSGRYEVIVVDDDSADETWRIAEALRARFPALRVVRRRHEQGLASAVIRGWQVSRGRMLGTINADFQHPPSVLAALIAAAGAGDLIIASRFAPGGGVGAWSPARLAASRSADLLGRLLLPDVFTRVTDPLSGCYLCRRDAIAGIELKPLGYKTLIEILARGRIGRIGECAYQMRRRERGRSKLGPLSLAQYIRQLIRLRRETRKRSDGLDATSKAPGERTSW
jgi:dolichol-phosphate mannosyltransferase